MHDREEESDAVLFRRFDEILQQGPRRERVSGQASTPQLPPQQLPKLPVEHTGEARPLALLRADWGGADEAEDWQAVWTALRAEAQALEEEVRSGLLQPRLMTTAQQADIAAELAAADEDAARWRDSLWSGLRRVRKRVHALSKNMQQGALAGQLQAVARSVEKELEAFKAQQRQEYETLSAGEREVQEEFLLTLGSRAEAWASAPSALMTPASRGSLRRGASAPPAEGGIGFGAGAGGSSGSSPGRVRRPSTGAVEGLATAMPRAEEDAEMKRVREQLAALDAEVKSLGGETGGWSNLEHGIFIRMFRSFNMKATAAFYARAGEWLPQRSEAAVADHVRWISEYENWQVKRRRLLARWRDRRAEIGRQAAEAREELQAEEAAQRRQADEKEQKCQLERRRKVAEWRNARMEEAAREEAAARAAAAARRAASQEDRQRLAQRNAEILRKKLPAHVVLSGAASCVAVGEPEPSARSASLYDHAESRLHGSTQRLVQKGTSKVLLTHKASEQPEPPPTAGGLRAAGTATCGGRRAARPPSAPLSGRRAKGGWEL